MKFTEEPEIAWAASENLNELVAYGIGDLDFENIDAVAQWLDDIRPKLKELKLRNSPLLTQLVEKLAELGYGDESKCNDCSDDERLQINRALYQIVHRGFFELSNITMLAEDEGSLVRTVKSVRESDKELRNLVAQGRRRAFKIVK